MITKRLRLYPSAPWWRNSPVDRLIVVDWIAAVGYVTADHWNKSYVEDPRINEVVGIDITWAPTGSHEIVGWCPNMTEARRFVAELETLLEMTGPLS
jgi:hypothetical protein